MGLMDRVKAQATQLAQKTQETARDSMAKFDQAQANRRADAMLRDLGAVVYAERTGRGGPDTQAQIDILIADISAHEAQNGISLASQAGPVAGGPGFPGTTPQHPGAAPAGAGFPPEPATGGFPSEPATGGFPPESAPAGFPPEAGAPAEFPGAAPADYQGSAPADFPGSAPADNPGAGTADYPGAPAEYSQAAPADYPSAPPAGFPAESAGTGFPPESRPSASEPRGTGFPPETDSGHG